MDLGCGEGEFSCFLASLGADVTALDISEMNINITSLRAKRNNLRLRTVVADVCNTYLQNASFDIIVGKALIHHLTEYEEQKLYHEVFRLLRPNGIAIFHESLQNSALLEFLRTLIPVNQKNDPRPSRLSKSWKEYIQNDPHPDRPNTSKHYRNILNSIQCDYKINIDIMELGIFSRLDRLTSNTRIRRWIHNFDYKIKSFIPFNRLLSRDIIITLRKWNI